MLAPFGGREARTFRPLFLPRLLPEVLVSDVGNIALFDLAVRGGRGNRPLFFALILPTIASGNSPCWILSETSLA